MSTNLQLAKKLLSEKRIKPTAQRLAVLSYLLSVRTHPCIDDIFNALKNDLPTISRTTLYNVLETFSLNGLADRLNIERDQARYDGFVEPHQHFLCDVCGKITDLMIKFPDSLVKSSIGHKVRSFHGYFYGTCSECMKKERRKDK